MAISCFNHTRISTRNSLWNASFRSKIYVILNFKYFYYNFRCQSVQNLGLAVVSIVSGKIVGTGDNEGYSRLELFFIIWLIG